MENPATPYLHIMLLVLNILHISNQPYKALKNDTITSLTLKITNQANNIITDGLLVTVVLHIRDRKI